MCHSYHQPAPRTMRRKSVNVDVAGKRRPARVIRHTAGHDLCRASRPHRPCISAPPSPLDANDRDGHEVELRDARPRAAHRRREVRGSPAVPARRRPEWPPAPGALRRGGRPGRPVRGAGQDPKDAHLTNRRERGHRRDRSHRPPGQRRGHGHRGRDCDLRHNLRGARRHRRRGLRPADRQLPGAVQRGRPDRGRLPQARRRRARERDPHRQTRGPTAPSHDPEGLGVRHADPRVGALVRRRRSTDALAITAASAAAAISDVPLKKPIAGVRVGLLPGETEPLINPTCEQMERSRLDLVLAGTEDAVMMIEGFGDFLTVEEMLYAVEKGHEAVANACRDIEAWAKDVGRVKNEAAVLVAPEGVDDAVRALVGAELAEAMAISVKQTRGAAVEGIRARAIESLAGGDDAKFTVRAARRPAQSLRFAFCSSFPSPPARAFSRPFVRPPLPFRHSSRSTKGPRRSTRGFNRRRTAQLRARRSTTREYLERTLGPPRGRTRALPTSSLCTYATTAIRPRPLARGPIVRGPDRRLPPRPDRFKLSLKSPR